MLVTQDLKIFNFNVIFLQNLKEKFDIGHFNIQEQSVWPSGAKSYDLDKHRILKSRI